MALATVVQTASVAARDEVRQLVNALATLRANQALTAAGVTIGTTTTKAKTANTLTFQIDGAFKSKGATDDFWTFSGTVVAASSWQKYLLLIDAAGAASIVEGVQSTVSAAAVKLPPPPQSKCIAAVVTIATDASHTFTPGTTALSATGVTATYADGFDGSSLGVVVLA